MILFAATFPWKHQNNELTSFFRRIGKLRRSEKVFREGFFRLIVCTPDLFVFHRYNDEERLLFVLREIKIYDTSWMFLPVVLKIPLVQDLKECF